MKIAIFLAGVLALVAVQPVWAESINQMKVEEQKSEKRQRTVKEWLAQANSAIIQVIGVKANPTDKGVEILLETSQGEKLEITNRSTENNYIVDLGNAQLRLPSGEVFTFRSEKPIAGITEITVTNQDANTIRVSVIGETNLPTVELFDSDEGLIFAVTAVSISSPPEPATQSEGETQEPIELVVTGEQDGYGVPSVATVTRTNTPIIDIPQSIQVIPRQVLEDQQITRIDDALRNVSGVVGSTNSFVSSFLTIRGFINANGVPILRDGFREYDNFSLQETANLERIEVLKGPASVQYGQLDPGGVINLVTKQPLSEPFAQFQAQFSSYGLIRPSLDISGPLTSDQKLLYRLNALYQTEDGFRDFKTKTERFFIAPTLTWNISDRTKFNFSLEYLDSTRPFDTGLTAFGDRVINVPYNRVFSDINDFVDTTSLNIGYNLEHRFSNNWTLRNAFRYIHQDLFTQATLPTSFNENTGILNRVYAQREYKSDDYSLQTNVVGKFVTGSINHNLVMGVDLNWNTFDDLTKVDFANTLRLNVFNPIYGVPRPNFDTIAPVAQFDTKTHRLGLYLLDQISFSDSLIVNAGFRYDTVDFRNTFSDASRYDDAVSPIIGIVYKPTKNISLYTSYSRSFVPNTSLDAGGNYLKPEIGEGYEVGIKAELLQGNLFATLAYFDITKKNVATPDPIISGVSVATGEQRSRGIELDVIGKIMPGWNIIANYAYTDAEVTQDNRIPIGNRLAGSPKYSASLWTTYEVTSGDLQGLGLGIGFNYVGERFGDLQNTFKVDSYFLTNAALFYRRNNWRAAINFNNIFDVEYISGAAVFARNRGIEPGQPFSVIGSISVEF